MRRPFAISAAIHIALLLFAIFGLDLLPHKPIDIPPPISVSMVKPSDMARTNRPAEPVPEKETPPEPQQSKAPEPPKESTPPPPATPQPPVEQKVETPLPPPPPTPAPPEKPPEKVLPKLAPVPQTQTSFQQPAQLPQLQKPVQPKPQPPKPDQAKNKQVDQDFQSLLTNLTPAVPKADQITKDKPVKATPQAAAQGQVSDQMTADELGLVRERLKQCWIVPAGAHDVEQLHVHIVAKFNQNKTLASETLVDTDDRYTRDPVYRAAADSAMRALMNPSCNPLPWPDRKFSAWSESEIDFNPRLFGE